MSSPSNWTTIGLMVGAFAFIDFTLPVIPHLAESGNQFLYWVFFSACVGSVIGQISLLAAWAALGLQRLLSRLVGSLLLATLILYAIRSGSLLSSHVRPGSRQPRLLENAEDVFLWALMIVIGWLALAFTLSAVSEWLGWRVELKGARDRIKQPNENQFHMGHLLLYTAGIGIALAVGRLILPSDGWASLRFDLGVIPPLAACSLVPMVLSIPCLWAGLSVKTHITESLSFLGAYVIIITLLEFIVVVMYVGILVPYAPSMMAYVAILFSVGALNLGHVASQLGCLLVLRGMGYGLYGWDVVK